MPVFSGDDTCPGVEAAAKHPRAVDRTLGDSLLVEEKH
jgi:hypothetical protein